MDINVRLMREGEAVRSIADSTVIAEEGQILLELKDETSGGIGVVLLEPMAAQALAIRLSQAAHAGADIRRYNLYLYKRPEAGVLQIDKDGMGSIWGENRKPGFWATLFGGRK